MKILPKFFLPDKELKFTFIRGSGPGGQNVNKVATAVQLRFDVRNSPSLTEEVKARLIKLAGRKATGTGELVIEAKRYRAQEQNRSNAEERLVILIQKALVKPKRRRETQPTEASKARRMNSKSKRAGIKHLRQTTGETD
jgi:ribosome-associated protein